jgi:hypothetical protein
MDHCESPLHFLVSSSTVAPHLNGATPMAAANFVPKNFKTKFLQTATDMQMTSTAEFVEMCVPLKRLLLKTFTFETRSETTQGLGQTAKNCLVLSTIL